MKNAEVVYRLFMFATYVESFLLLLCVAKMPYDCYLIDSVSSGGSSGSGSLYNASEACNGLCSSKWLKVQSVATLLTTFLAGFISNVPNIGGIRPFQVTLACLEALGWSVAFLMGASLYGHGVALALVEICEAGHMSCCSVRMDEQPHCSYSACSLEPIASAKLL